MSVDISAQITSIWPTTEDALTKDTTVDYAAQKTRAIARAKRALYGSETVPAEASIPELAAYWIADKAVTLLIPLARDFYMVKTRISDSKEGATLTHYDKVQALNALKTELEASLAVDYQAAYDAATSTSITDDDAPEVSTQGMMVDAVRNAHLRGAPGVNPDWNYSPLGSGRILDRDDIVAGAL